MNREIALPWAEYPRCPCGHADCEGLKLSRRGHVVRCICIACRNSRNVRKGKRAQAATHKNLGGTGFTPSNEESARPYVVEVSVMPEVKAGKQIPANWDRFEKSEWFRHALSQSERAVPFGSGVLPCVVIRGQFAIVDIRSRQKSDSPAS